jgi:hypothetical protein
MPSGEKYGFSPRGLLAWGLGHAFVGDADGGQAGEEGAGGGARSEALGFTSLKAPFSTVDALRLSPRAATCENGT